MLIAWIVMLNAQVILVSTLMYKILNIWHSYNKAWLCLTSLHNLFRKRKKCRIQEETTTGEILTNTCNPKNWKTSWSWGTADKLDHKQVCQWLVDQRWYQEGCWSHISCIMYHNCHAPQYHDIAMCATPTTTSSTIILRINFLPLYQNAPYKHCSCQIQYIESVFCIKRISKMFWLWSEILLPYKLKKNSAHKCCVQKYSGGGKARWCFSW